MSDMTVYKRTKDLIKSDEVRQRFEDVFRDKQKTQAFLASLLGTIYSNDDLAECDPNSILASAMKAAILDLPIEASLGQAYIVPYKGKAVFQPGYKGLIQLAHRTNNYEIINVSEVFEGEQVKVNRITGVIDINGNKISDNVIGYFGYFKLRTSGFQHYLYMTVDELTAFAKRYSPSYNKNPKSLWHTDFPSMAKKTIIKQMLTKFGELQMYKQLLSALEEDNKAENIIDAEATEVEKEEEKEKPKDGRRKKKVEAESPVHQEAQVQPPIPPENPSPVPEDSEKNFDEEDSTPISLQLVAHGYFTSEIMAKTALRFYTGNMFWKDVEPWAQLVIAWMNKGQTISAAAVKANQGDTP